MSLARSHYLLFSEATSSTAGDEGNRWTFVLESVDGSERIEASDIEDDMPRERVELLAVVRGLEALPNPSRVTLVTGSRYVNRGMRFGLEEWRENQWQWERFGQMSPVGNADLWQRLDRALEIHQVQCRSLRFDSSHAIGQPVGRGPHRVRTQRPAKNTLLRECAERAGSLVRGWLPDAAVPAARGA